MCLSGLARLLDMNSMDITYPVEAQEYIGTVLVKALVSSAPSNN